MFQKINSSPCLRELMTMELSSKALKEFLGAEGIVTDTFNLILQSEENEGFCYKNTNEYKVSYYAGAKLLLCKWCDELSLDSSNGLQRLNLTKYVERLELTKMRLCVCSECPTVNGLTLRNCGPEVECTLGLAEKKCLLESISPEVKNNLRVESALKEVLGNPSRGMSAILFDTYYKGLVRPNICGCGNCSSKSVYITLDEVANHVTFENTGFVLFEVTLENCPEPFVTDICWADVFMNTITDYIDNGLYDYKVRLPLYKEDLRKILEFSGITHQDFQRLMTARKYFKVANRTYGMRKVLKFVTVYNMWAKFHGLTLLRADAYKDKRLIKQCQKFLTDEKLLESDESEGTIETAVELRNVAGVIILDGLLEPVQLPTMVEVPDENASLVSSFFTDSLEKLQSSNGFDCLEKVRPGIRDRFIENAEYNMVNSTQLMNNWLKVDVNTPRQITFTEFNQIEKACRIEDPKKKADKLGDLQWEVDDLASAMNMKTIPKKELEHTRSEFCDGRPPVEKTMKSGVVKTVRKKGGSCAILNNSGVGHQIEYPVGMIKEQNTHTTKKRSIHLESIKKNKTSAKNFVLEVVGLKDSILGLELDVERKESKGVSIVKTSKHKTNFQSIILDNKAITEGTIDHVAGFSAFIRKRFVDFVNSKLVDGSGYHLGYDFKMSQVKYLMGVWDPSTLINMLRSRIAKDDFFNYDQLEKEYLEKVKIDKPLNKRNLYNNVVKAFNKLILKKIRNRKSFTRLLTLSDEEKFNLVLTLSARDFDYSKQMKTTKTIRSTEVRRILSCLERNESREIS